MRVTKVWISYDRTVNLGDYNSAKVSFGASAEVEPGDNEAAVMQGLWEMAKANVKANVLPLLKKDAQTAAEVEKLFLGIPELNYSKFDDPEAAALAKFAKEGLPPDPDKPESQPTPGLKIGKYVEGENGEQDLSLPR